MASIEERVESLIQPKIEELGYTLYDVQYVKEASNYFLRVFIEKDSGVIDLDDCEKVNDGINDILDTADYIKEQYFLEVSSTGLEKLLRKDKHLQDNIGIEVEVKLFKPMEVTEEQIEESKKKKNNKKIKGQKEIIGILKNFNSEEIILNVEDKELSLDRKNISNIKTVFDWTKIEE